MKRTGLRRVKPAPPTVTLIRHAERRNLSHYDR